METMKKAREAAGLSKIKVARAVGVCWLTYHRWESGKFQPRADQLVRLAKALGTTTEELLHEEAEEAIEHGEGGKGTTVAEDPGAA